MCSPNNMVQKIFKKLDIIYGPGFRRYIDGKDYDAVKAVWAEELEFYADEPESVAWALKHLPEHCPNVIEFRNLCRQAPKNKPPALPAPAIKIDESKAAENRRRIADLLQQFRQEASEPYDKRAWARRIIDKYNNGQEVAYYSLNLACATLGLSADSVRQQREVEKATV